MKKIYLLLANLVIGSFSALAQVGVWSGDLEVQGIKLPVVFHLEEEGATMDSPAQGAKGIPVEVEREEDSGLITISIPMIGASFQGKLENDRITGTFKQNGYSLPLILNPGENKPKRPQTPTDKGPYTEEEGSFSNGDAVLKGTLTLPEGFDKSTPVVLMVTGSGLQNRDEEIFDHKPFAVIADYLARNGVATLRYDDRGFGQSTGDVVNCTTEDLMRDALAGADLLRGRFDKVGVLGHSEGGTIALMLAADHKVDFIVSLAGMVVSGKETLLAQNRKGLSQAGLLSEENIESYCRILSALFDGSEEAEGQLEKSDLSQPLKQNLKAAKAQMERPYMRYFVSLDQRESLNRVECPVLALNGTKDMQVFYEENLEALKSGLPVNKYNKIEAVEGVNHLFQHCDTGSVKEYGMIEETISPQVLEEIAGWIKSLPR